MWMGKKAKKKRMMRGVWSGKVGKRAKCSDFILVER